ncbi:ROK family protein [Microbacterium sp. LWH3-1.2]|uniref:ROK family protein n=1 Tax=Microbacterium sp. LWH3-1.2 TaxID=3135256 RepID=UPI00341F1C40
MNVVLAVDLGGTKIEAALLRGSTVLPNTRARQATGRDTTAQSLTDAVQRVVQHALDHVPVQVPVVGVGIASAGPIDCASGRIMPVNMPHLAAGYPLLDVVKEAADLGDVPVRLGHDGGCIALAESWLGATKSARTSLTLVVSTGVGGGIIDHDAPLLGATGNAGHLGQMRVGDSGLTLEELASGPASVAWARTLGWGGVTGEQLAADAASGDATARAAIVRSATTVGHALASVAALIDIDAVAVGGGFSRSAPDYVDLLARAYRESAPFPHLRDIPIERSALGTDGPLQGGAALALRAHRNSGMSTAGQTTPREQCTVLSSAGIETRR